LKKISLTIILGAILLLFACQASNNNFVFNGENETWSAKVTVNQSEGNENYQIQLNYKGNNIEEIDTFHYEVKSKNDGNIDFAAHDATLNKDGIYFDKLLISNSPTTSKDDELVLKIHWNDNSDSFTLINK